MDRQKLLMIFGGAWLSAALLTWLLYSATSSAKQMKMVKVQAASRDLSAGTRLRKGDLRTVSVPEKEQPKGVFLEEKALIDRTLLFPVSANAALTQNQFAAIGGIEGVSATIPPGKRAVSVPVTDATSAAGLILPRSHVDVVFTRTGSMSEALSKVILEDIVVLSVGRMTEVVATDPKAPAASATTSISTATTSRAITLLVTPEEAAKMELAKNNGKIGLVLRNPLDASRIDQDKPIYGDALDPYLGSRKDRLGKTYKGMPGAAGTVNNNQAWDELTGMPIAKKVPEKKKEEPPVKPAPKVVDVYRGDKHVQEVFEKIK